MLLFGGVVFSSVLNPVFAQTAQPTETPMPNPTIMALEAKINALESQVETLNARKDVDKQSLENQVQKELIPIYIWFSLLSLVGVTSITSAAIWINNFIKNTKKQVEDETRKKLDQAFYNADPLHFPLYVPDQNFALETERLKKLGFKDVRGYKGLREGILDGVIVVRIPGENFKDNKEDMAHADAAIGSLEDFIQDHKADKKRTAFVLYVTGGQLQSASKLAALYGNVVIANMPVTIAEHVYAMVRGLTTVENKKEDS
jgi:hypothetical protein